jgi:ketosteroid isomerase-like protein
MCGRTALVKECVMTDYEVAQVPAASEMRAVVERYAAAVHQGNQAELAALFGDDCVVFDPYPSTAFEGPRGVRQWWDTMVAPLKSVTIDVREHYICGNQVVAVYTTTASLAEGVTIQVSGVDIFTVSGDAKIFALYGYWDPMQISTLESA